MNVTNLNIRTFLPIPGSAGVVDSPAPAPSSGCPCQDQPAVPTDVLVAAVSNAGNQATALGYLPTLMPPGQYPSPMYPTSPYPSAYPTTGAWPTAPYGTSTWPSATYPTTAGYPAPYYPGPANGYITGSWHN